MLIMLSVINKLFTINQRHCCFIYDIFYWWISSLFSKGERQVETQFEYIETAAAILKEKSANRVRRGCQKRAKVAKKRMAGKRRVLCEREQKKDTLFIVLPPPPEQKNQQEKRPSPIEHSAHEKWEALNYNLSCEFIYFRIVHRHEWRRLTPYIKNINFCIILTEREFFRKKESVCFKWNLITWLDLGWLANISFGTLLCC